MAVTTVIGSVTREELGIILSHEHIFINLLNQFKEPSDPQKQKLSREPISLANYGFLRRNPYAIRENVITLCRGAYRSGQSFVAALTERGLGLEFGQRPPSSMAATVRVATRSGSSGNNACIWHSYQIFASLNIDLKQCYTPLKASFYVKITRSIGRRPILFNHMYSIRLEGNSRVRVKYTG